ncbi:SDR family NAD(P)-dependent oxidoreductase [Staphylococcus canis]|uniref:Glucose 1-dehydrogenase n=1 Tax=Staphylococcus canis TaxID=2724942 RepID=A0ABS0T7W8_9STAP|nr:glucose 1-dehydrogenase [Staphylococcus canis]MBI5974845.1 glucose 1-dehydrogenase [Staphylococcus canis]
MLLLEDKVAIITGAAGGLGKAQALAYAKQGAKVVITDINQEQLDAVEQEIIAENGEVLSVVADIGQKKDLEKLVSTALDTFGKVDICVNNAAILANFKPVLEIDEEEWDRILNINLKSIYRLTHLLLPHFLERGSGTFINVSSIGGTIAGVGDAAYITSKHAINGFTKQLTYDYAHKGIRAVNLAPGLTASPMVNSAVEDQHPQALRQINSTPTGKIGQPEEIAFFSAYLASDYASRINGTTMHIDGGQSIGGEAKWVDPTSHNTQS